MRGCAIENPGAQSISGSTPPFRVWEDVEVGEVLPRLEFPITAKTMVLAVCGTRDLMPYHHDPAYSKSVGNRDLFVNTIFDQALLERYVPVESRYRLRSERRDRRMEFVRAAAVRLERMTGWVVPGRGSVQKEMHSAEHATALLLAGEPIGESIVGQGPFVMDRPEEIRQAVRDGQSGKMGRLPVAERPRGGD